MATTVPKSTPTILGSLDIGNGTCHSAELGTLCKQVDSDFRNVARDLPFTLTGSVDVWTVSRLFLRWRRSATRSSPQLRPLYGRIFPCAYTRFCFWSILPWLEIRHMMGGDPALSSGMLDDVSASCLHALRASAECDVSVLYSELGNHISTIANTDFREYVFQLFFCTRLFMVIVDQAVW